MDLEEKSDLEQIDCILIPQFKRFLSPGNSVSRNGHYYHYTSLDTLKKIVESREFRASPVSKMNDPAEIKYSVSLIIGTIRHLRARNMGKMDGYFDWLLERANIQNVKFPFAASFTTQSDHVPMWRLYADNGRGVCICFPHLVDHLLFLPCNYNIFDQSRLIRRCVLKGGEFALNGSDMEGIAYKILWNLSYALPFFKLPSWRYEKEWRVVFSGNSDGPQEYRMVRRFEKNIGAICFGPRCTEGEIRQIESLLEEYGLSADAHYSIHRHK